MSRLVDEIAMIVGCQPLRGTNNQLSLQWLTPQLVLSRETSKNPGGLLRVLFEARSDFAKLRVPTPRHPGADLWQHAWQVTIEKMDVTGGEIFARIIPLFVQHHVDLTSPMLADAIYFALSEREKIASGVQITDRELAVAYAKVRQLVVG